MTYGKLNDDNLRSLFIIALILNFIALGYQIFYSSFILDEYYNVNNTDDLESQLKVVWITLLVLEVVRAIAIYYGKALNERFFVFYRTTICLHGIVIAFLPILAIVYLIESVEKVDEGDKMFSLVCAYVILLVGMLYNLPWTYYSWMMMDSEFEIALAL